MLPHELAGGTGPELGEMERAAVLLGDRGACMGAGPARRGRHTPHGIARNLDGVQMRLGEAPHPVARVLHQGPPGIARNDGLGEAMTLAPADPALRVAARTLSTVASSSSIAGAILTAVTLSFGYRGILPPKSWPDPSNAGGQMFREGCGAVTRWVASVTVRADRTGQGGRETPCGSERERARGSEPPDRTRDR